MSHLIYSAISSLDGYIEDTEGKFDWAEPDDEVFKFIIDLERPASTHLYGRRMYETMTVWETDPSLAAASPLMRDFAEIWQSADKIVFSKTLQSVSTRKTQIQREFDPAFIRKLKETAMSDILIGGSGLAAHAFQSGLIDECQLFLTPILVGGGKQSLPTNINLKLELLEERSFGNGMVYLRYRTVQGKTPLPVGRGSG